LHDQHDQRIGEAQCKRPDAVSGTPLVEQHADPDQLLDADEQEAEVVRQEQRRRGKDVGRPGEHGRPADHAQLRPQRQQAEQRHEGVHTRFLRVPDEQWRGGAECSGDEPRAPVVELAPQEVERGDHERPRDQ
jgi:hypothetical protein